MGETLQHSPTSVPSNSQPNKGPGESQLGAKYDICMEITDTCCFRLENNVTLRFYDPFVPFGLSSANTAGGVCHARINMRVERVILPSCLLLKRT